MNSERHTWQVALLVVGVLAVAAVWGVILATGPETSTAGSGTSFVSQPEPEPTTAAFLGDSYTQGVGSNHPDSDSFALLTADRMGWVANIDGQSGTGYLNDGSAYSGAEPGFTAYGPRVAAVLKPDPDVVVVSGGRNDLDGHTAADVAPAAEAVVARLDTALPDTGLVVVAPFWTDGHPPAEILALREVLRGVAQRHGAVFVDPLAEEWITDANAERLVADDGIHPNDAGHAYLAKRLAADLERAGVGS